MTDVSKVTTGRLKVGASVIAAFDAQGGAIATAVEASPNAPPAGVALAVIAWVRGALHNANEGLRAADLAHALEGDDDHAPRLRRDTLTRELRAALLSGSDGVRGVYGRSFGRGLGLEGALPERPDQLLHHAESVLRNLATHTAPEPEHEGSSFDLPRFAARVEGKCVALKEALESVSREERELQTTLSQRDQATSRWLRTYAGAAMILSGMATLAGLDDLAAKVKPTERKRAGIAEEEVL
jgi:hypothetical protein